MVGTAQAAENRFALVDGRQGKSGLPTVPGWQAGSGLQAEPRGTLCSFYLFILLLEADQVHLTLLGPEWELVGRDRELGRRGKRAGKWQMAQHVHVS